MLRAAAKFIAHSSFIQNKISCILLSLISSLVLPVNTGKLLTDFCLDPGKNKTIADKKGLNIGLVLFCFLFSIGIIHTLIIDNHLGLQLICPSANLSFKPSILCSITSIIFINSASGFPVGSSRPQSSR